MEHYQFKFLRIVIMKLKKFTPSKCTGRRSTTRTVSFNKRNGYIFVNQATQKDLDIKESDKITFVQDEENPKEWFLMKSDDGFTIKRSSASGSLYTMSKEVANNVIRSLEILDNAVRVMISDQAIMYEGQKLYPLVTRLASPNKQAISPLTPKRF